MIELQTSAGIIRVTQGEQYGDVRIERNGASVYVDAGEFANICEIFLKGEQTDNA